MKWQVRQIILRYRCQAITAKQRYKNVILVGILVRRNFCWLHVYKFTFFYYKHPLSIVADWIMSYKVHSPCINVVRNSDTCEVWTFSFNTIQLKFFGIYEEFGDQILAIEQVSFSKEPCDPISWRQNGEFTCLRLEN